MPCRSLGTGARCGPTDLLAKGRRIVAELQRWRNNNNESCADGQPLCSQWRSLAVSPRAVPGLPRELSQARLLTTALRPNVGLWRGGIPYLPGREAQRPATKGKTRTLPAGCFRRDAQLAGPAQATSRPCRGAPSRALLARRSVGLQPEVGGAPRASAWPARGGSARLLRPRSKSTAVHSRNSGRALPAGRQTRLLSRPQEPTMAAAAAELCSFDFLGLAGTSC